MSRPEYEIVIPTVGRPSLGTLLDRLGALAPTVAPVRVWVVDDRPPDALRSGAAGAAWFASQEDCPTVALGASGPGAGRPGANGPGAGRRGVHGGCLAVTVLRSGGRGPAAARNVGWRAGSAPWVVFLDDDVLPGERWGELLRADLAAAESAGSSGDLWVYTTPRTPLPPGSGAGGSGGVGGVQGRIRVPLPGDRRATDWERNVAGLERARWATADLAYRRDALELVGGFDERFRRNYREDADLGLRVVAAGWSIVTGRREIEHPVGPTRWTASVARQRGNADDVLMRRLHGPAWRDRAAAPPGRLPRHALTAAAGLAALALAAVSAAARSRGRGPSTPTRPGRATPPRPSHLPSRRAAATPAALPSPGVAAALAGAVWAAGTAELAWARIVPGPRTPAEVAAMVATSVALPFAALWHRLAGEWRWRAAAPLAPAAPLGPDAGRAESWRVGGDCRSVSAMGTQTDSGPRDGDRLPAAVLFDRDGTLIEDVPYNGDPLRVVLQPGALDALATLRAAGIPTAVVSNQSGIARGLLTPAQVAAVNERVDELLGGVGPWLVCPHGPADRCGCRKPAPGLVLAAAAELGVAPERCVVIGDIGADVAAARAAGARAVLVPTPATLAAEVDDADEVAPDILSAVRRVLARATA
jgi:histidinol-phosphate phosphatase family protein